MYQQSKIKWTPHDTEQCRANLWTNPICSMLNPNKWTKRIRSQKQEVLTRGILWVWHWPPVEILKSAECWRKGGAIMWTTNCWPMHIDHPTKSNNTSWRSYFCYLISWLAGIVMSNRYIYMRRIVILCHLWTMSHIKGNINLAFSCTSVNEKSSISIIECECCDQLCCDSSGNWQISGDG